jgi:hypothetical protein
MRNKLMMTMDSLLADAVSLTTTREIACAKVVVDEQGRPSIDSIVQQAEPAAQAFQC